MREMNTFCRKCGSYTASKLVNLPKAQEIECRCAVCGKFKDVYSYGERTKENIREVKNQKSAVFSLFIVCALIVFIVSLFSVLTLLCKGEAVSGWYVGALIVSLITLIGCVLYQLPEPAENRGEQR